MGITIEPTSWNCVMIHRVHIGKVPGIVHGRQNVLCVRDYHLVHP